jgi:hypothetical protein
MVVVLPFIELINRLTALKIAAIQNARLLKLSQYPIDCRQTHIGSVQQQHSENVFRGHVSLSSLLEYFQNLQSWKSGFKTGVFQFVNSGHEGRSSDGFRVRAASFRQPCRYNALIISSRVNACYITIAEVAASV